MGVLAAGAFLLVAILPNARDNSTSSKAAPERQPASKVQLMPSIPDSDDAGPLINRYGAVSIQRATDSHFYADAQVNGAPVRFLIDTGATSVVLTPADAERAGITGDNYTAVGKGVGGEIPLMPSTADRLTLGPIVARDVPLMVAKKDLPISLLGQSYLSGLGAVSISGDTMTLQ